MATTTERALANHIARYERAERNYDKKVFKDEAEFQRYVTKRLNALPRTILTVFKCMKANKMGVSDLILCCKGKYVAIELKHKGNTPTAHQKLFIDDIRSSGGIGEVAWTWKDVKDILAKSEVHVTDYEIKQIEASYAAV